jgi:hypothetical protein
MKEIVMRRIPLSHLMLLAGPIILSCDRQPTQPSDISAGSSTSSPAASLSSTGTSATTESEITLKFDPHNFVHDVDNRFFPLRPGTRYVYKGIEDGEQEVNVTIVTHDRKDILGVSAVVVFDRVFVHGELKEKTFDWYAQDKDGNVWYLGENTKEFENGQVVSTEGSWKAGGQGAKPGIIMLAHPHVADRYFQEFLPDVAEDQARVVGRDIDIRVPYGSFHNCLKTVEWTRLEPGVKESKVFCPGVGFVKAHSEEGPFTSLVLTNITQVAR